LLGPIGIAGVAGGAPVLPSRIWCISSRTNPPAWVVGLFPSRLSFRALRIVSFSGMTASLSSLMEKNSKNGASRHVYEPPCHDVDTGHFLGTEKFCTTRWS